MYTNWTSCAVHLIASRTWTCGYFQLEAERAYWNLSYILRHGPLNDAELWFRTIQHWLDRDIALERARAAQFAEEDR